MQKKISIIDVHARSAENLDTSVFLQIHYSPSGSVSALGETRI